VSAPDVGAAVVSWNTRALTLAAIGTLLSDARASGLALRVVVVDNASADGSADAVRAAFPDVELIASVENLGFVRANNLALERLGFRTRGGPAAPDAPRAVYLLHPDTETPAGATRTLFDALMARAEVGMAGPALRYGDGGFQHAAFAFPGLRQLWAEFFPIPGRWREGRFNGRYPRAAYAGCQPFAVDFVLGAAMMVRREAVERVGGLDEAFFMYCEEIDWAWRMRRAGFSALCVPAAVVVHHGGQSSGQVRPETLRRLWSSRLLLYGRHYPAWKRALARGLVRIGLRRQRGRALAAAAGADRVALAAAYDGLLEVLA
jgi:GT2 family glycosyltransferase